MDLLQAEHPEIFDQIRDRYRKSGYWRTKALISLKFSKIGPTPRLLLRTNRKLPTHYHLVPTSPSFILRGPMEMGYGTCLLLGLTKNGAELANVPSASSSLSTMNSSDSLRACSCTLIHRMVRCSNTFQKQMFGS